MLLKQIPEIMINVNLKKNPHFPIGQTMCVFSYSQFSKKKIKSFFHLCMVLIYVWIAYTIIKKWKQSLQKE